MGAQIWQWVGVKVYARSGAVLDHAEATFIFA